MAEYRCVICQHIILAETIKQRHYSFPSKPMPPLSELTCSNACQVELRKRAGYYQKLSQQGNAAMKERGTYQSPKRRAKIAQSDRENPRRRKR